MQHQFKLNKGMPSMMNKKKSLISQTSLMTDDLSHNSSVYKWSPRSRREHVFNAIYEWNEVEQERNDRKSLKDLL